MSQYVVLCSVHSMCLYSNYVMFNDRAKARTYAESMRAFTGCIFRVYHLTDVHASDALEIVREFTVEGMAAHDRRVKAETLREFAKELHAAYVAVEHKDNPTYREGKQDGLDLAETLAERHADKIEKGTDDD